MIVALGTTVALILALLYALAGHDGTAYVWLVVGMTGALYAWACEALR